ncbi:ty3-gypsy retrotransposon protein [Tanacetum coccineum]
MKLRGTIGTTEVLILVDGGSTHNFISNTLVPELKMVTVFITPFGIQIGNGDIIRCNQHCKDISVKLPYIKIVQDFYPFSIEGVDLVLGVQWLATLNTSMDQHMDHSEQALTLLHDHRFFAKLSKCCFGQPQVVFWGHLINFARVHVEQEKIIAIQSWPVVTFVREISGFIGLIGYHRRFVHNYGMIARPRTDRTKKDYFLWSIKALTDSQKLKQTLISTMVLRLLDFSNVFMVECDASSKGMGAIRS